ncbi:sodium-dependent transporter [Tepidibacter formicigenes]|jgi:SNF family Na+-dependent transporter|uniref:Transporter n=1 Tax=Tepidibacter formicigenes DSM 15518 TaxID=1123349 RepID=A0A1M6JNT5_9FIRM|nr:sodium-dependent transporter [Tepidibacter formicigenes]SHJ48361.1 Na+-dependent transporter, SNF family [Tepidibacter formicigenes DSM 15518]
MSNSRENWGSKIGLILAMAGNAIGLGNFWRFPYQAASNGGGAFMIPYFAALIIIGIPVMLIEWNLGRYGGKYGHGTLGPMVYLQAREGTKPRNAAIIGAVCGSMAFAVTLLVNSYYNHIIGWTLGYSFLSVTGGYMDTAKSTGEIFVGYVQNPSMVFIFWVLTLAGLAFAVMRGVQKGIEAWAKLMMPVLYTFGIILAIRALTIGSPVNPDWSAMKGLNYIWNPDFSALKWKSAIAAAGQVFFTLSIGMGIICNYASYLKPDDDVVVSSFATISLNEFAEVILGGTAVIPIAYAFMGPEGVSAGVGLSFIALPNVFRSMGGGQFVGSLWFLLLFFAGFTSAIAMYNYLVALMEEDLGIQRSKAAWIVFIGYIVVGLPVGLEPILTKTADLAYLTEVDNWVGSYLLIVLGVLEVVVAAWLMGDKALEEMNRGGIWKIPKWFFNLFHKTLTPLVTIILLFFSTIDYIKAGYFKLVPSFVEKSPQLVPWVNGARVVIFVVFIAGFMQSYKSIKTKYAKELDENKVSIRV